MALFVDEGFTHQLVDSMSVVINDVMECITVEINIEKMKNVLVSCVYRKPCSNIDTFMVNMERLFTTTEQKVKYVGGDFNIDLLNSNKQILINSFT